jgi:phage terminase large subunit GpA-like protein
VWPRKPSSNLGNVWYMIGGNAARDWAYGSLATDRPGPRFIHFTDEPANGSRPVDEEFFAQLTTERLLADTRKNFTYWDKPHGKAREVGVCFVYAYAAVCGLQALSGRYVAMGKIKDDLESSDAGPVASGSDDAARSLPAAHQQLPPSSHHHPQPKVSGGKSATPKRTPEWIPKRRSGWL